MGKKSRRRNKATSGNTDEQDTPVTDTPVTDTTAAATAMEIPATKEVTPEDVNDECMVLDNQNDAPAVTADDIEEATPTESDADDDVPPAALGEISDIDSESSSEMITEEEKEEELDASLTATTEQVVPEETSIETANEEVNDVGNDVHCDESSDIISEAKTEHVSNVDKGSSKSSNKAETDVMNNKIEIELGRKSVVANGDDVADGIEESPAVVKVSDYDDEHPDDERDLEPVTPVHVVEMEEKTEDLEDATPESDHASPAEDEHKNKECEEPVIVETPPLQDNISKQEDVISGEPVEVAKESVSEPLDESSKIFYTLEELKTPIDGVDWACRENALSDDDFQKYFEVSRGELKALPKWKRQAAKKTIGLF